MLIIDDILMFPVRSLAFIFREVCNAAEQETANEAESIRTRLTELYMMLETGQITEEAFDAEEEDLLKQLDDLEAPEDDAGEEESEDES